MHLEQVRGAVNQRKAKEKIKNKGKGRLFSPFPISAPARPFRLNKSTPGFCFHTRARRLGMSRLCSAINVWPTFGVWCSFAVLATSSKFCLSLSNFWAKYRFRAHIKHEKVNDFIENFNSCEFLECLSLFLLSDFLQIFFFLMFGKLRIAKFPAIFLDRC